jgi:inosine-uridine nucleoside N-ribohydrolase
MNVVEDTRPQSARPSCESWWLALLLVVLLANPVLAMPRVIFDTDYRSDCDDVGALAILHALQDLGRADTIGAIATTTGPHVIAAIDAVSTYYQRSDIPVGLITPESGLDTLRGPDDFAPLLANPRAFVSTRSNTNALESTALYRQLLHAAPTNSVTIVVVGGQTAIHRLLQSGANHNGDDIVLTGPDLISNRVRELVIMGGHFADPDFAEYNITLDVAAARQVARAWPSPIVYSGYEIGNAIRTGAALSGPATNPVAAAYQAFRGTTGGAGVIGNRQSWDQTAVLYAVDGATHEGQTVWQLSAPHHIDFTDAGRTLTTNAPGANRFFLIEAMPQTNVAAIISGLMTRPPDNPGKVMAGLLVRASSASLVKDQANGPLRVHPDNPRYFADNSGKAILLAGSHTWPNLVDMGPSDPPPAFDFDAHLAWLKGYGHNFTRGWTWEPTRWNTTAMKNEAWRNADHHVGPHPWQRTGPGLALDGKPKFDLEKLNPEYLERI